MKRRKDYTTQRAAEKAFDKLRASGIYDAGVVYDAMSRKYRLLWDDKKNPARIFTKKASAEKLFRELKAKGEDVGIGKDPVTGIWKVLWAPKFNPAKKRASAKTIAAKRRKAAAKESHLYLSDYGAFVERPRRKNPTKAQKQARAKTAAAKRRVAVALAKFLKQANPAMKTAGAAIQKLKGGVIKITPIKINRRGKR